MPTAKKDLPGSTRLVPASEQRYRPKGMGPLGPAETKPQFKKPKNPALASDRLYEVREERLGHDRVSATLKLEEGFLREYIIEEVPKSDAMGAIGKVAQATIKTRRVPIVEDWSKLYAGIVADYNSHVKKKTGQQDGAFALLNRALNGAAVEERWEAGKEVAGVGSFTQKSVSLTKVK